MRGMVLTLDAVIAMMIMTSIISLLIFFRTEPSSPFFTVQQLHTLSEDSLNILSESTFGEVANQTILADRSPGGLFNTYYNQSGSLDQSVFDKKAIDVIGMLWAENNTLADRDAANITKDILGDILPDNLGYQFCINDCSNGGVYNSSDTSRPSESDAESGISSGRIASGYESNKSVSGCVALAYLSNIKGKRDSAYAYFGGFVGNGNITTNITLPSNFTVKEAYMEMNVGNNFTLYINGNPSGYYINGSAGGNMANMTADKWIVCNLTYNPSYCNNFTAGENNIQINFTNKTYISSSYIGGGYFRVTYNTTELAPQGQLGYQKNRLPGIDGVINLYDSFYVPGNLSAMNISLYFKISPASPNISMYIGNTRVIQSNISPIIITNSMLATMLNYTNLSERTIPIRIGHYIINVTNQTGYATDVVLTTSLANQMDTCDIGSDPVNGTYINVTPDCNSTNGIQNTRIDLAKALDKIFVNVVLNNTGNRVGLLGYVTPGYQFPVPLTTDNQSLINNITAYQTKPGERCTCCAIDTSIGMFNDQTKRKYIILMSDGVTDKTDASNCGKGTTQCWKSNLITQAQYNSLTAGEQATVDKAFYARNTSGMNITVDTIGFGPTADNNLLNLTAICGGGQFKSSANYSNLTDIYKNLSADIANETVLYAYQSIVSSSINSTLFSNSSIEINYNPQTIPEDYGNISLTMDGATLGNLTKNNSIGMPCKNGTYYFPPQVSVVDAKMTSYSSDFWTDRLSVQNATGGAWNNVFNLSYFGYNYLSLGDPFIIYVPYKNLPVSGNNYSVCIGTGYNTLNTTGGYLLNTSGGSPDDKLIYTIRVKNSVPYGNVNETCSGATTDAWQRLNDTLGGFVDFTSDEVIIQNNSISKVPYMWGPANMRIRVWS